jgi:hypothetical protein
LNSTPQLVARDRRAIAHFEHRAAPTGPAQDHPQLSLNSAALDTRGALAIYLRPEKSWFKFPIHIDWECLWIVTSKVLTAHVTAVPFVFMSG